MLIPARLYLRGRWGGVRPAGGAGSAPPPRRGCWGRCSSCWGSGCGRTAGWCCETAADTDACCAWSPLREDQSQWTDAWGHMQTHMWNITDLNDHILGNNTDFSFLLMCRCQCRWDSCCLKTYLSRSLQCCCWSHPLLVWCEEKQRGRVRHNERVHINKVTIFWVELLLLEPTATGLRLILILIIQQ